MLFWPRLRPNLKFSHKITSLHSQVCKDVFLWGGGGRQGLFLFNLSAKIKA